MVDGAATIQYRVHTVKITKRRILPEPVIADQTVPPAPSARKKSRVIIERDAGMSPEARAMLEEFKANARSSIVARSMAQEPAPAPPSCEVLVIDSDDDHRAEIDVETVEKGNSDLALAVLRNTSKTISLLAEHVGDSQDILEAVRTNALLQRDALEHL